MSRTPFVAFVAFAAFAAAATMTISSTLSAQTPDSARRAQPLGVVSVTATRTARSTFDTPQPITVLDSVALRERLAHGAVDLFRDVAGLDASGVGPNQRRPEIRGQRGQRILLLEDGLRLNNARRQQDFGELPALAGIGAVQRVEVVRGPASVLYGTDAIGGVINLLTAEGPNRDAGDVVAATLSYRHGSAGKAATPDATVVARLGRFSARGNAAYREAGDYVAPKGSFGDITLAQDTRVFDSGIRDRSWRLALAYDVGATSEVFARAERYEADKAGFGFVDPALFGPGQARVQLFYPDQVYTRYAAGYRAHALSTPFATRAELTVYTQANERHFNTFVLAPAGPGATVDSKSYNFTDLGTVGGRLELARPIGESATLTYGLDAFRDESHNTDSSRTVVTGFGPPSTTTSNVPAVPNAVFQSGGMFAQLEFNPTGRLTTVAGARAQLVSAKTRETPNITRPLVSGSDRTAVWTANALYRLATNLNLVASVGRGFRAPNLVERFFEGRVSESGTFMRANADLAAETSVNVDLGVRARRGPFYGEGFVFRNDIGNAIRSVPTGQTVNGQPEVRNENVSELRVEGLELTTGIRVLNALDASGSFTRLLGRNMSDPGSPVGDTYASKVVGELAYRPPSGVFMLGYTVRYQGEQKDVIVGVNPVGPVVPAFFVHSARASVRLPNWSGVSNRVSAAVENLGNALYAETPNVSFFRPEPGRHLRVSLTTSF
jgi:hemoglobin/transferrin/lactoferrin receptor protein